MAATGMRFLGSGHPPLHRFRLGLEFALSGHREVDDMIAHHAAIARTMARAALAAATRSLEAIGAAYERWDGRGWPGELEGEEVPLASRVAHVAEFVEVANRMGGVEAARQLARERRGGRLRPARWPIWSRPRPTSSCRGSTTSAVWDAVIDAEPALAVVLAGERFDAALLAIANFVDLKSPYFLGHGRAVSELAAEAGARARAGRGGRATAAPRRSGARPRAARGLERDPGQARTARRRRVGARPPSALPDRAHAAPVRGARARGPDRRAAPRAPRRLRLPARALRRRDLPRGAHPRRRGRLPGDARAPSPPPGALAPTRPRPSCGPTSRPAATTPTPSRPCSAPPATASRGAARGRPG